MQLVDIIDNIQDEEIKEAWRTNVIEQCSDPDAEYNGPYDALNFSMTWSMTKQGSSYWANIHNKLEQGEVI